MSLALPWEVIERVIEHSSDSVVTLYSFTLTCRDLNPRSTTLLLGRIVLKDRDQLFSLCDVLRAKPHLQPAVRSITIPPDEFSPHPLLRMLCSLSEINFAHNDFLLLRPTVTFHRSILKYCHQFGRHVQTLCLRMMEFSSLSALSDILQLFPRIHSLSCSELKVSMEHDAHQELVTRRPSERLRLRTFAVQVDSRVSDAVLAFLGEVAKRTVASLVVTATYFSEKEHLQRLLGPSSSSWVQLTSFVLKIGIDTTGNANREISYAIETLNLLQARPPMLEEVTIEFQAPTLRSLTSSLRSTSSELCSELEKNLLGFSKPNIRFSLGDHLNIRGSQARIHRLQSSFPMSVKRHALTIKVKSTGKAGHDEPISTSIVISADSRWAATGSLDGTVIIWDLESGSVSQDLFIHCPDPMAKPHPLAFSPDTRYIASTGLGPGVTVWDLHRNACIKVASLEDDRWVTTRRCTWSPDGTFIAVGCSDGTVRIWEANTFQQLHSDEAWEGQLLALSLDGRRVLTGVREVGRIWNVASGKLHRALRGHTGDVFAAAFNSDSTRIVTAAADSTIRTWDAETGEGFLILQVESEFTPALYGRPMIPRQHVTYSPDGELVLSWSPNSEGSSRDPARIWDASTGALLASLSPGISSGAVASACFSPCSRYITLASDDGEACLWRASDRRYITTVSGDESRVDRVAISPDGRVLCCARAKDGTVFFRRMCDLVPADQSR